MNVTISNEKCSTLNEFLLVSLNFFENLQLIFFQAAFHKTITRTVSTCSTTFLSKVLTQCNLNVSHSVRSTVSFTNVLMLLNSLADMNIHLCYVERYTPKLTPR